MSDKVIPLGNITRLDLPVDQILEEAKGQIDGGIVLLGWDKDGDLYFASSIADGGEVLWLIEQAKRVLLDVDG